MALESHLLSASIATNCRLQATKVDFTCPNLTWKDHSTEIKPLSGQVIAGKCDISLKREEFARFSLINSRCESFFGACRKIKTFKWALLISRQHLRQWAPQGPLFSWRLHALSYLLQNPVTLPSVSNWFPVIVQSFHQSMSLQGINACRTSFPDTSEAIKHSKNQQRRKSVYYL